MIKAWILPCAFVIAIASTGRLSAAQSFGLTGVWIAFELLIYQSRYQWNDIRGFESDQAHPDVCRRGRLPGPSGHARRHKLISAGVAVLRLALAAIIGVLLPSGNGLVLELGLAAFGLGFVDERLKDRATAGEAADPSRTPPAIYGLWFIVGGGYAVRGLAGLSLAVDLATRPLLGLAATAALWAYGISFVTSRWAFESLAFTRVDGDRLLWRARADQALMVSTGCAGAAGGLLVHAPAPAWAGLGVASLIATVAVIRSLPRRRVATFVMCGAVLITLLELAGIPRCLIAVLPWAVVLAAQIFARAQTLDTIGCGLRAILRDRSGQPARRAC